MSVSALSRALETAVKTVVRVQRGGRRAAPRVVKLLPALEVACAGAAAAILDLEDLPDSTVAELRDSFAAVRTSLEGLEAELAHRMGRAWGACAEHRCQESARSNTSGMCVGQ